jgi:hypothetical protein
MRPQRLLLCAVLPLALLVGCGSKSAGQPAATSNTGGSQNANAGSQPIGKRTRFHNCVAPLPLQDQSCTPGAIFPSATTAQICKPGYSRGVRNVSSSTKRAVYLEYGIRSHRPYSYEVDHLISLELGGSNSIANLWPEPASPTPGYHQKDQVENYLHDQVCSGKMPLSQAQRLIAHNWLSVWHQMGH